MHLRVAILTLACVLAAGCGGGGAPTTPVQASTAGLPSAVASALPGHVSPNRLLRGSDGCYAYQVGTPDLGYVAPLIAEDGTRVCV